MSKKSGCCYVFSVFCLLFGHEICLYASSESEQVLSLEPFKSASESEFLRMLNDAQGISEGLSQEICNRLLFLALERRFCVVIRVLVTDFSAEVNTRDAQGFTALDRALARGNFRTINLLHKLGARVGVNDPVALLAMGILDRDEGQVRSVLNHQYDAIAENIPSLCHLAFFVAYVPVVKLFIAAGASIHEVDENTTPLDCAVYHGHRELVVYLLEAGAEINAADKNGVTALHLAAVTGNLNMVKLLVTSGADIHRVDIDRSMPLVYAKLFDHQQVYDYLRAALLRT